MFDFITACWFGVIGACVGSFLNVVAYRMPLGMSVIWKPSHCPRCKTPILTRDNVPVLGWLWLRGKCRSCSEPISPRYAIVEAVMGLVFFTLAYAELFSGGANLPAGPLTEGRGANENVLQPHWPLLGVYAYHCVLLCVLMCYVLIEQDHDTREYGLAAVWPFVLMYPVVRFWPPLREQQLATFGSYDDIGILVLLVVVVIHSLKVIQLPVAVVHFLVITFFVGYLSCGVSLASLLGASLLIAGILWLLPPVRRLLQGRTLLSGLFLATWLLLVVGERCSGWLAG